MVLQHLVFACFQGGKGPFLAVGFILQKYSSVEFHFGGETAWLEAPDVALRCVWIVSYSSELECILADFLFPPRECILANFLFPPRVQHNCLPVNA